jgi:hypothetical protein
VLTLRKVDSLRDKTARCGMTSVGREILLDAGKADSLRDEAALRNDKVGGDFARRRGKQIACAMKPRYGMTKFWVLGDCSAVLRAV